MRVGIIGLGLIGGSLGLALRRLAAPPEVVGYDPDPAAAAQARTRGAVDRTGGLAEAGAAEVVFLCAPVGAILELLRAPAGFGEGSILTDVGSTKGAICRAAATLPATVPFVGGHPLAGKATAGMAAAEPDLFRDRPWVLTPGSAPARAVEVLERLLTGIGARPVRLDPERHDRIVAATSHLPQVTATALALVLADRAQADPRLPELVGPGLTSSLRLAASPFGIWGDIFRTNAPEVVTAIEALIAALEQVRDHLETPELARVFAEANRAHGTLCPAGR